MSVTLKAPSRIGLFVFLYVCLTTYCHAQVSRLDVSKCFSPLLVTHEGHSSETNWEWFYLSMIDETTFKQIKDSANTSALLPWGFFTGDFAHFSDERRKYFELQSENIRYYQAMSSSISYLPPSWQPTIQKCIHETLQGSSFGLTYFTENVSPEKFRLQIKYRSTETVHTGPYVKSSEVDGGYIVVKGAHETWLYPPCKKENDNSTCPNVNSKTQFTVVRDNPNKPVTITLELSNWEHSTSFDVDIVPKKIKCSSTYEGSPKQTTTLSNVPLRLTEYTHGSGGWEAGVWTARAVAPGRITAVPDYVFPDPAYVHLLKWTVPDQQQKAIIVAKDRFKMNMTGNPDWQDDVVLFVGTQNGDPPNKKINITVEYQEPHTQCDEKNW